MSKKFLMGNEAIALGALAAGVSLAAGYPGTPSTEILETLAKNNPGNEVWVEWSVNEKAALEVAAGAAFCGARALVTMKQVGLNVAADPMMSLAYVGVKGGLVVVAADDPGPISSQTEQDTRNFAQFAKVPVFDPSSPEEAYLMVQAAFALSEERGCPVLLRPTTRVCHGCAVVEVSETRAPRKRAVFHRDSRWVIFPRLSYNNHLKIEKRRRELSQAFSASPFNQIEGTAERAAFGIACGGVSYAYVKEALELAEGIWPDFQVGEALLLKIGNPYPFPEELAAEFLERTERVLVCEELDPVIERELFFLCGKKGLRREIRGKLSGHMAAAGESSAEAALSAIAGLTGRQPGFGEAAGASELQKPVTPEQRPQKPALPIRPPVLCAGCPHRASFYAVKEALKGRRAVFTGDIGCYTLGNAQPLDMVDTCLCMGADVTIAQGIAAADPGALAVAFIGDSTFFASGLTGIVNGVYNLHDMLLIVVDNSTTAMTGHQPHPGTPRTLMGVERPKASIEALLLAAGASSVRAVDPLEHQAAKAAVRQAAGEKGLRAIIFRSPCIALEKGKPGFFVDSEACAGCRVCISDLGCPALIWREEEQKAAVEPSLCYGCSLCAQVCPVGAIRREAK